MHTKGEKETQSVFCLYFCVSRWLFSFYDFLIELLFVMVIVAAVVVVVLLLLRLELKRRRWQWIGFEWCDRWTQQAESATTARLVSVCSQHSLSTVTTHGDAHTTFNCFFFRWENKTLLGQQSQKERERERERERDALCKLRQAKNRSLSTYWASRAVPFIFLAHLSGLDGTGGWMESENHRLYSLVVAVVVNAAAAAAAARGRRPYLKIIRQWRRFSFIPLSPSRSYSAASSSQTLFFLTKVRE